MSIDRLTVNSVENSAFRWAVCKQCFSKGLVRFITLTIKRPDLFDIGEIERFIVTDHAVTTFTDSGVARTNLGHGADCAKMAKTLANRYFGPSKITSTTLESITQFDDFKSRRLLFMHCRPSFANTNYRADGANIYLLTLILTNILSCAYV